jgi:hypothetical protein
MLRNRNSKPVLALRESAVGRAGELLTHGAGLVEEIGRRAGADAADALEMLETISESTSRLLEVNLRLVPLMTSLQRQRSGSRMFRWFTGEQLEYDVRLRDVRDEIEQLAADGQRSHAGMEKQMHFLVEQHRLMGTELELLETDIAAGHLLASPEYAAQRRAAGVGADDLARLTRRTGNLEAMATATQLTRAQFVVAIQHAISVADRYQEIRTLLLPIWKQAIGFDLFSRRVVDQIE